MDRVKKVRTKICCISSIEEAQIAIAAGACAIGLVSKMPSGPGIIDESTIAEISKTLPPAISSFLLTSETDPKSIISQQKRCRVNTIQLCDMLSLDSYESLTSALPGITIVQVLHVESETSIIDALRVSPYVHGLLLDSGAPNATVRQLGGTGRTHNWEISRRIRESVDIPTFLAGGLSPKNVKSAIETVGPYGVDICSGVRTDGKLDPVKLEQFIESAGQTIF